MKVEAKVVPETDICKNYIEEFHLDCEVEKWIVTDIDNYLDGNPHTLKLYSDFQTTENE